MIQPALVLVNILNKMLTLTDKRTNNMTINFSMQDIHWFRHHFL